MAIKMATQMAMGTGTLTGMVMGMVMVMPLGMLMATGTEMDSGMGTALHVRVWLQRDVNANGD